MSEVKSRSSAPRGRGSHRAGRGGHISRGEGRAGGRYANGETPAAATQVSLDDQGELGQLKKKYLEQLDTLRELFPDWTDDDLVFALNETDGDLQSTIERISEGTVERFTDVKSAREKPKPKPKEHSTTAADGTLASTRGRSRGGLEGGRGGRGRGSERGRGGSRGARGGANATSTNIRPTAAKASVPTAESTAWDTTAEKPLAPGEVDQAPLATVPNENPAVGQWATVVTTETTLTAQTSDAPKSSLIPEAPKKSWASMLAQPKKAPPVPKTAIAVPQVAEPPAEPKVAEPPAVEEPATEQTDVVVPASPQPEIPAIEPESEEFRGERFNVVPEVPEALTPPKDKLTVDNLEHVPDSSGPLTTDTVASTRDPHSAVSSVAPYGASQQPPPARPPMGGYATTAWKAAAGPGRSASYQRRMMEQREAVVMPGNHAVDRAAVQFGSLGLNGEAQDVDEDREDTETRQQPPQPSPPSQPRTSLPQASHQPTLSGDDIAPESFPTPKQPPGYPLSSQPPSIPTQPSSHMPSAPPGVGAPGLQQNQSYAQYGRYGGASLGQEHSLPVQKPYDAFSQQLNYPHTQPDTQSMYASHGQPTGQMQQQHQAQSQLGGYSQAPGDIGSHYAGEQTRGGYPSYYSSGYAQQASASQDQHVVPPRASSGFGTGESGLGGTALSQVQSRFSETHNSGNNTPQPAAASQHHMGSQPQQGQPMHQQPHGQSQHGAYPYNTPYYSGSYYNMYASQFPNSFYNQQGYGTPFNKSSMYGQPHHGYGMSPQTSYEHSSSPANTGSFGSSLLQGRDNSAFGSDYGRSGSTQPSQAGAQHSSAAPGFPSSLGAGGESFGRSPSGFSNLSQQYGGAAGAQSQSQPESDPVGGKPGFPGDASKTGPSPSMVARTGSAANSGVAAGNTAAGAGAYGAGGAHSSSSGFPPPGAANSQYGGYPSHSQHSHLSQLHGSHSGQYSGAFGGLGGHQGSAASQQSGQASGYGGYGGAAFGGQYGNYARGGGWGTSYH